MLECHDIQKDNQYSSVKLCFNDESADEVLTISMRNSAAVDMARWIMQNWGGERYVTMDQARKIIKEEVTDQI